MAEKSDFQDLATIASADHIEEQKRVHVAHDGGHIEGNALLVNRQARFERFPCLSRILQGISTGASESLLPLMLAEITFLHERAYIFGIYWMVQNAVSSSINLASSYINADLGWRWYYWVFTITVGVGLIIAFLLGFETQFTRPAASLDGQLTYVEEISNSGLTPPNAGNATADIERKTHVERLRPWSKPSSQSLRVILLSWKYMLASFSSPGIFYAVLTSSIVLGYGVGMSLTYNEVLMQHYHWEAKDIGLINVGGVIGAVFGMLYCTFLANPFVLWMARRNRDIHEPEHHLITMAPPAVIGVGMLLLYGFTAGGGATWWGPYLGWTIFQYSFTAVVIISTTFASEAAPKHAGPALVTVVGTKNIVSLALHTD
ncbi:hypothetical protein FGADI_8409 [Fusarium gaditjirri]|uniref:Major facilitator superfamily (MFS) profile domain-containing protein n=1 Tax=Fusarium gaditjirri TaxID=282569 RepID=A0A8H4T2J2_9HYPO|nr:hypothetical protein FGADI_8409 [Fusarium gaditjirri]